MMRIHVADRAAGRPADPEFFAIFVGDQEIQAGVFDKLNVIDVVQSVHVSDERLPEFIDVDDPEFPRQYEAQSARGCLFLYS